MECLVAVLTEGSEVSRVGGGNGYYIENLRTLASLLPSKGRAHVLCR